MEEFIPAQGRTVVFGFRNPAYWTNDLTGAIVARNGHEIVQPFVYRPAQIVRVWGTDGPKTVNLVVFVDGGNDHALVAGLTPDLGRSPLVWKTSIVIGDSLVEGSPLEHYLPRLPDGYTATN